MADNKTVLETDGFETLITLEPRAIGDNTHRLLFVVLEAPAPLSPSIFDSISKPLELTLGRGYHFAYTNVSSAEEINETMDEYEKALKKHVQQAKKPVSGSLKIPPTRKIDKPNNG